MENSARETVAEKPVKVDPHMYRSAQDALPAIEQDVYLASAVIQIGRQILKFTAAKQTASEAIERANENAREFIRKLKEDLQETYPGCTQ